jgi:hypothetical protein
LHGPFIPPFTVGPFIPPFTVGDDDEQPMVKAVKTRNRENSIRT